jgi:hypothetical protein
MRATSGSGEKLAATACLAVVGLLVPMLEANATHLLNPSWPAHARLHEAWQLATNTALSVWAVYLTWRGSMHTACLIGLLLTGGFLLAWVTRSAYGGSMTGTSTASATIAGADAAAVVMGFAFFTLAIIMMIERCRIGEKNKLL